MKFAPHYLSFGGRAGSLYDDPAHGAACPPRLTRRNLWTSPTLELLRHCSALKGEACETIADMLAAISIEAPAVDEWLRRIGDSLSLVCAVCAAIVVGGRLPQGLANRMIERINLREVPRRGLNRSSIW